MPVRKLLQWMGPVMLAIFVQGSASPEAQTVESRRALSPVRIDGQADEWRLSGLIKDKNSGVELAFQNDGRNLYILVVLKSPDPRKAVEATGMTILSRPGRAKKPENGVLFLSRTVSTDAFIAWQESRGALLTEAEKAEIRKTARHAVFMAFAVDAKGSTYGPLRRQSDSDPPDFGVSESAAQATYEFRLPLASPEFVPGGIGAGPGETVRVLFEWGGVENKMLSAKASRQLQTSHSGYLSGTGRTWSQEFLDTFDAMSRPTSSSTKRYSLPVDVNLAQSQ
ncbi:MAG: hypothetical protein ABR951_08500 [Candidatus Aminicenantales bacterium]